MAPSFTQSRRRLFRHAHGQQAESSVCSLSRKNADMCALIFQEYYPVACVLAA